MLLVSTHLHRFPKQEGTNTFYTYIKKEKNPIGIKSHLVELKSGPRFLHSTMRVSTVLHVGRIFFTQV